MPKCWRVGGGGLLQQLGGERKNPEGERRCKIRVTVDGLLEPAPLVRSTAEGESALEYTLSIQTGPWCGKGVVTGLCLSECKFIRRGAQRVQKEVHAMLAKKQSAGRGCSYLGEGRDPNNRR